MTAKNLLQKATALTLTATAILAAGGLISSSYAYEKGKVYKYTVLSVNDTHGHFWPDARGQGGFAAVKTIVNQIRNQDPTVPVIVLHAGDVNTGVPESDLLKAAPDIAAINDIKFDAVTVGNHEFDVDIEDMKKQKEAIKVPYLSANIIYKDPKTGQSYHFYDGYVKIKKGDLSFLIIGTTTPSTKYQANPVHTKDFTFTDPTQAFQAALADADKKFGKSDVVISSSHLGFFFGGKHGTNPYGDYTLATKLGDHGADAYVTGHTHVFGCVQKDGVSAVVNYQPGDNCTPPMTTTGKPLFQTDKWNMYVGRADFEFKDGVSTLVNYRLIPVNVKKKVYDAVGNRAYIDAGAPVAQDPELYAKLKKYQDEGQAKLKQQVGTLDQTLTQTRFRQTKIGTLFAEAYRSQGHADVMILNSGAIRDDLRDGPVTYRDILICAPFANTITTVDLTGKELEDYIKTVAFYTNGARPQYAGVTFDINAKHELSNFKIAGKPLDPNKTYKLAVLSFQANGGDRYPNITSNPSYVDTGYNDAKSVVDYFLAHPNVKAADIVIQGPGKDFNVDVH